MNRPSEGKSSLRMSELSQNKRISVVSSFETESSEFGVSSTLLESIKDGMLNSVGTINEGDSGEVFGGN